MPVRKTQDVSLTPEMEAFVDGRLASGRYRSASEVIHSALRLLAAGELGQDRETSARASLAVPHEGQAEPGGLDAHFRALLEIDTVGVVFFDDRGGISDANDAFLRLVGFTRAEMAAGLLRYDERTPPEWRWKDDEVVAELAAGHEVAPFEKEYLRKDGSRIWILCAPKALGPGRAVEFVLDVTERRRAEERLRLIVENVPDYAIFTTDPDDRIETWLPGAEAIFGWSAEEAIGQPGAIIFTPQDRAAGVPAWELSAAQTRGRAPNRRWHLRKDGSQVFIEGSTTALGGPDGVRGYLKIGQDVTVRKQAEERQALLVREVDHRAKNALAIVRTILRLTRAKDLSSFIKAVDGRVTALARAQTLLALEHWKGADLCDLLRGELAPFLAGQRAALEGPRLVLPVRVAQPLAVAVHELATNAAKYGALSVADGRVSISWQRANSGRNLLRLCWSETGGPPIVRSPTRSGFGSRVLTGTVGRQLGGAVSSSWKPEGLVCEMEIPLDDTTGIRSGPGVEGSPQATASEQRSEDVLAMAERHVREAEARIARQVVLIDELDRDAHPEAAVLARKLLASLEQSLALSRAHLDAARQKRGLQP